MPCYVLRWTRYRLRPIILFVGGKTKMKKMIALTLALVLALSLTACNSGGGTTLSGTYTHEQGLDSYTFEDGNVTLTRGSEKIVLGKHEVKGSTLYIEGVEFATISDGGNAFTVVSTVYRKIVNTDNPSDTPNETPNTTPGIDSVDTDKEIVPSIQWLIDGTYSFDFTRILKHPAYGLITMAV